MQQHYLLKQAAAVARTFRLDPVLVLDEPDEIRKAVRIAAHNVVVTAENKPK
jgi:hypothetical protein